MSGSLHHSLAAFLVREALAAGMDGVKSLKTGPAAHDASTRPNRRVIRVSPLLGAESSIIKNAHFVVHDADASRPCCKVDPAVPESLAMR